MAFGLIEKKDAERNSALIYTFEEIGWVDPWPDKNKAAKKALGALR